MKTCTKCGRELPLEAFWRDRSKKNGYLADCKDCRRRTQAEYRARHPEANKAHYWKDRDKERSRHLVAKYGITLADYEKMLDAQDGKCAICGRPEPESRSFDVDHDHATGEVRGLLCTSCNRMIGHGGDDPDRLRYAAEYLESCRKSRRSS